MKLFLGFVIAFLLGAICEVLRIPLPAPTNLLGATLVIVITCGYLAADMFLKKFKGK